MRSLTVSLDQSCYSIHIGSGLYRLLPELLQKAGVGRDRKLMIITDSEVAPRYADRVKSCLDFAGYETGVSVFPAGESNKNLQQLERLIGECLQFGLDRSSLILALGGGVVGDVAGFVAATYMRGIPFIQLPTTLLAHDSSVGGKVGVNHPLGKNYIGSFHQPVMVVFDVDVLHTLPKREIVSGFAEVVKHALIWDVSFVKWLEENTEALLSLEPAKVEEAIYRGCRVKAAVVSQDEKESGIRAILNYGHTIGHALEAVSGYQYYTHGEAVAIGMAGAARLSQKVLGSSPELITRTEELLQAFQLPVRYDQAWLERDMLQAMKRDKKARRGEYAFVLSRSMGQVELIRGIEEVHVSQVLKEIGGGTG
ncbi:3-dehydroquinate synthase [Paenactinomyces guangxiensis]|uniref:3-dehydroquinate synthase n=1 Tax=Paenactinomyces guangxiensis TaxID=1490290 RepID=A0A7W1WU14_9BACL|nr:3-dehydroquinate synthase [Paenactinomyces guangxiensis]MBA4496045.1 3-dehydroquinate synthase [Paenactinomyces guangxiensis]MBH8593133.1 3-dehydroquinate synthase [Paenactinomyces guangxiensis]